MTVPLLLTLALPVPWIAAGLVAGALPAIPTASALLRRCRYTLLAIGAGGLGLFASAGWWLSRSPAVLGALAVPVAAALVTAVPRLVRLGDAVRPFAAAGRSTPAPRALRAAAGHPLLGAPIQLCGYGATAALLVGLGGIGAPPVLGAAAVVSVITAVAHATRYPKLVGMALRPQRRAVSWR